MEHARANPPLALVTGGAGFVGGHLVAALRERGARVRVLDLEPPTAADTDGVELVQGSVTDRDTVARAMAGAGTVYHLAALADLWVPDKRDYDRVNDAGTRIVLDAAAEAGVDTLVHCSTEAILRCGRPAGARVDEDVEPGVVDMAGPYCRAKLAAERAAFAAAGAGRRVIVVSPTVPMGPGDPRLTAPTRMLIGFLNRAYPAYLDTWLNIVDVRDVAAGLVAAAARGRAGRRYVLGAHDIAMADLLARLERLSGVAMPRHRIPYWLAHASALVGELVADHLTHRRPAAPLTGVRLAAAPVRFSNHRARTELGVGFRALDTTLADAIADLGRRGLAPRPAAAGAAG